MKRSSIDNAERLVEILSRYGKADMVLVYRDPETDKVRSVCVAPYGGRKFADRAVSRVKEWAESHFSQEG